jgi:hypothetical protein
MNCNVRIKFSEVSEVPGVFIITIALKKGRKYMADNEVFLKADTALSSNLSPQDIST